MTCADGRWACHCLGFKFRGTECKHIRMVRGGLDSDPAGEPAEPVLVQPVDAGTCPHCSSTNSLKNGLRHNKNHDIQRYRCLDCGRRFSDNLGFEGQRASRETVTEAINLHFDGGMSSRGIQRHLKRHKLNFSHVAICKWISGYSDLETAYLESIPAQVGERWHADEVHVNGKNGEGEEVLFMMSGKERFIVAHAKAPKYKEGKEGPLRLFKAAKKRCGVPLLLVTDKRPDFAKTHREVFTKNTEGKVSKHLYETHAKKQHCNNNVMERLNGTFRDHLKSTCRIGKVTSEAVGRYVNYYNFFRSHMGLDGDTPADRAGIVIEGDNKLVTVIQNATRKAREPPGA